MTIPLGEAHRRRRARRRLAVAAALLAPTLLSTAVDLARRGPRLLALSSPYPLAYLGSLLEVAVLWALLLYPSARRRGALRWITGAAFAALYALAFGVQGAFFSLLDLYATIDASLTARSLGWALLGTLPVARTHLGLRLAVGLAVAIAGVALARRLVRPRRGPALVSAALAPLAIVAVVVLPVSYRGLQAAAPEVLYVHGVGALVEERLGLRPPAQLQMARRTPEPVPALTASPARPRNVLFLLHESLRPEAMCVDIDPGCHRPGRFTNPETPNRLPLLQVRANASSTLISAGVLWSGLDPFASPEQLRSAPLLWAYARAAGLDTAYWTSQHVVGQNLRLLVQDQPLSRFAAASNLDPAADFDYGARDGLLTDRVIADWGALKEPFFAVVHFGNTHTPYLIDPADAPYQPAARTKDPAQIALLRNYYKNAIYASDKEVARLIRHIRSTESGKRTILVFTSDHAESLGEHLPVGHTYSAFDNEIHVPSWVDAPPGTLSEAEEATLREAKHEMIWHVDFAPTMLDLMGVWDAPALAPFRRRMIGHPFTRPQRTGEVIGIANCNDLWASPLCNWGLMQGAKKAMTAASETAVWCSDILVDPRENQDLGEAACGPLPALLRARIAGQR